MDHICSSVNSSGRSLCRVTFYCEGLMMVYTLLYLVGVPETDSATKRQLPHQQIVHPPESKLQILHLILFEMIVNVLCRHKQTHMLKFEFPVNICIWKQLCSLPSCVWAHSKHTQNKATWNLMWHMTLLIIHLPSILLTSSSKAFTLFWIPGWAKV